MLRGSLNYYFYLLLDTIFEIPHMYLNLKDAEKAIEEYALQTNSNFCTYRVDKNFNKKGIMIILAFSQNNNRYIFNSFTPSDPRSDMTYQL